MLPQAEKEPHLKFAFEIIRSSCASFFVHFDFKPHRYYHYVSWFEHVKQKEKEFTAANWCWSVVKVTMSSIGDESPSPLKLDKGVFLICGDQAWAGILSHLVGGPCTLGRLSLALPNMTLNSDLDRPKILQLRSNSSSSSSSSNNNSNNNNNTTQITLHIFL